MMLLSRNSQTENNLLQPNMTKPMSMETPDGVFDSFWSPENSFPAMSFPPSDYLHDKDTSYDMFLDAQGGAGPADWSKDTSSFAEEVNRASTLDAFAGMPSTTDSYFCPPTLAANGSSPWTLDGSVDNSNTQQEAKNQAAAEAFASPRFASQPAVAAPRTTRRASASAKSQTRADSRAGKGVSSSRPYFPSTASSTSSGSSRGVSGGASGRHASASDSASASRLSGHGGNHKITLRTASRKPKPAGIQIKTEGNSFRQPSKGAQQMLSPVNSAPSSPDGMDNGSGNGNPDNLTSEERRARQNHNVVEKQYRNRLNSQFEKLLAILPANERDSGSSQGSSSGNGGGGSSSAAAVFDDRRMSKAEVLELARRRIHALEQERLQLRAERQDLLDSMQQAAQQRHQQQRAIGGSL